MMEPSRNPKKRRNRCGRCGLFKPWGSLICHFVPDTAFSSEDETWWECRACAWSRSIKMADLAEFDAPLPAPPEVSK